MFTRAVVRARPQAVLRRAFSDAPAGMTLNFTLPHSCVYDAAPVESVKVPGMEGEYGITAGHTPIVSQLKPGMVSIVHKAGEEAEKYFVSGGFALTHADSSTDISALEAVKLDDLDLDAIKSTYSTASASFGSAEAGSMAKAEAQIQMETAKAMAAALDVAL